MEPDTPELVRRTLWWLVRATVALYLVLILLGAWVWWHERQTRDALCTFRGDLVVRADASSAFLRDHPEGFAGVPAASIQQSIDGQRRTIAALAALDC